MQIMQRLAIWTILVITYSIIAFSAAVAGVWAVFLGKWPQAFAFAIAMIFSFLARRSCGFHLRDEIVRAKISANKEGD